MTVCLANSQTNQQSAYCYGRHGCRLDFHWLSAGYSLARYAGLTAMFILIAALAFRALPRLAFILPYYRIGSATNLLDTHLLIILMLAVNQPFTFWMLSQH